MKSVLRTEKNQRVLVTTLTKRMAEDLAEYYTEVGVRCRYLHSEVETLERIKILRGLRKGEFDVLIGINLLREGLDLPEVSLVAILDADKEGFLRSADSLIQTIGRAARHLEGRAHSVCGRSHRLHEARDRRDQSPARNSGAIQPGEQHHPGKHHQAHRYDDGRHCGSRLRLACRKRPPWNSKRPTPKRWRKRSRRLEDEMREAARKFEFERAAQLRDKARALRAKLV